MDEASQLELPRGQFLGHLGQAVKDTGEIGRRNDSSFVDISS